MRKPFFVSSGLLVFALSFCLVLAGCGNGTISGGDAAPFQGNWTGTVIEGGAFESAPGTFTVSGHSWTFSCPDFGMNGSGTMYILGSVNGEYVADLYQGAAPVGAATSVISSNELTVSFYTGAFNMANRASCTFTK